MSEMLPIELVDDVEKAEFIAYAIDKEAVQIIKYKETKKLLEERIAEFGEEGDLTRENVELLGQEIVVLQDKLEVSILLASADYGLNSSNPDKVDSSKKDLEAALNKMKKYFSFEREYDDYLEDY